ncbi:MAG TPA: VWA domain-containing protein [Clostridia bacterium]|nr:VWA domain-containing protein [Clostridia bacterium]
MRGMKPTQLAENLVEFVHLLRLVGLRISAAEVLDAFRALEQVELAHKPSFKAALQCTLIKRAEDLPVFREVFRVYFAPPEQKQAWVAEGEAKELERQQEIAAAEADLVFQGEPVNLTVEEKLVYASLTQEAKERLKDFLRQSSEGKNVGASFKPLIESLVRGQLQYWQKQGVQNRYPALPDTGNEEWNYLLAQAAEGLQQEYEQLLQEDMRQISEELRPEALRLIHLLSRRLATRLSRRYRQSRQRLRLDLRRTIRHSISSGGTMFRLSYKSKRVAKPQLVLVCDVSGSMKPYVSFIMQFIAGLVSVTSKIETFLFAERLKQTTSWFQKGMDLEDMVERVFGGQQGLGTGTDLYAGLTELRRRHMPLLQRNTIMIIVSDTKTMNGKEAAAELRQIREQVREIVWLNTLPGEVWDRHPTVALFQPYCQMYQCNTIKDLEAIISRQLLTV